MSDLENRTRYEPSEAEPRVFERWERSGRFHPEPEGSPEENFSIAIPPPNVTGALHMGHALNGSIQDALIRHARMQGRNTKWILGTDHAGIATQTQVERFLREQGTSREEIGREEFVRGRGSGASATAGRSSTSTSAWAPPATTPRSASRSTTPTRAPS